MTAVDPPAAGSPGASEPKRGMSTAVKVVAIVGAVLAVMVVLGGLIMWSVLALTAPPVNAANAFFTTTARSGPAVSYNLASPSFRSVVTEAQWDAYARRYGLAGYTGASWSSRNVTNNVAILRGSLKLAGGGALPATVQLTNGGPGWQVLHLTLADGGVATDSTSTSASSSDDDDTSQAPSAAAANDATSTSGDGASPSAAPPAAQTSAARQIPGAMLAGLCRQVLAQQSQAVLDSIECPDSLPTRQGATTACMVRKGGQSALMTARLDSFDPATGHFTVDCKVADHPLS